VSDAGWLPSRPVAAPPSSPTGPARGPGAQEARRAPASPLTGAAPPAAAPPADRPFAALPLGPGPRVVGLPVRRRRRLLPRPVHRVAASAGALLLAGAVLAAAAAVQPRYGEGAPLGGTAVEDLREAPVAVGPGVDLADALAPGVPPECLRWTSTTVSEGLAVVRGAGAWSYGAANDGDCATAEATVGDRVGLLDLDAGALRWVHDAADDLAATGGVRVDGADDVDVWAPPGTGLVLLRVDDGDRVVLVTLDRASGRVVERVPAGPVGDGARTLVEGPLVALASRGDGDPAWAFELRDVRTLGRVAWSGTGDAEGTALALADRLVVDRAGGTVQVDLATGAESAWGSRLDDLEELRQVDDGLVALRSSGPRADVRSADAREADGQGTDGGGTDGRGTDGGRAGEVVALDADGAERWAAPTGRRASVRAVRDGVVVLDPRQRTLTLLDAGDGRATWTVDAPATSVATVLPGQRDDSVFLTAAPLRDGPLDVRSLDGATGLEAYGVALPDDALLVASGRTVGYALAFGVSGARSTLVAFDLSDGTVLWRHAAQLQASAWAGRLVDVDVDGTVRVLAGDGARVATP